jgi:hypothetical protein
MSHYAIGIWGALYPSEPHDTYRVVLDLQRRTLIAAERRHKGLWTAIAARDFDYLAQVVEETPEAYDNPAEIGLLITDYLPALEHRPPSEDAEA